MTSILTNNAAMVVLSTLRSISNNLDTSSNRVSTGQKISTAADGAAYWSIAAMLKSDNGALGAVKDAIALDKNSVDAAATGLNKVLDSLDQIKTRLTAATSASTDRAKLQTEITSYLNDIKTAADNTVMNGANWLSVGTTATGGNYQTKKSLVLASSRNGASVAVGTSQLDTGYFTLYDKDTAGTDATVLAAINKIGTAVGDGTSGWTVLTNAKGFMDTQYSLVVKDAAGTDVTVAAFSISSIDISGLKDTAGDLAKIQAYARVVDATISALRDGAAKLGSTSTLMKSQMEFTQKLMDINSSSVGALVDANMEEESSKLKALQTQQQLAVQALSIANSSSQNVLSLFR